MVVQLHGLEPTTSPFNFSVFCGKVLETRRDPVLFRRRSHEQAVARQPARTSINLRRRVVDALAANGLRRNRNEDLYQDDEGRSTILFKMAPGAVVPLHEHTALEQTFMLEGSLEDAEGSVGAGDFVWRPGGNIHVAHAPNGATFLAVFNRPNRFFDGTKFFTSAEEGG